MDVVLKNKKWPTLVKTMGWGPSSCDPNYGTNILLDSESKLEPWKNLLNTWSSSLGKKVEFFEKLINRLN